MGNSEVGHLTIGAGRRLYQDLMRVNKAIEDGSFFENPALRAAFERGRRVHLLGLVSHGGVHSHIDHLQALLRFAPEKTWIHAFTDGRDVSPTSAVRDLAELPRDRIATVVGRYYAMDRDQRWERTQRAFDAITVAPRRHGRRGRRARGGAGELRRRRHRRVHRADLRRGRAAARAGRHASIFFNFRPDRGRQLTRMLLDDGVDVTTMTRYAPTSTRPSSFAEQDVPNTIAEVLARARAAAAARRRDREVRPRHVLLQRRRARRRGPGETPHRSSRARATCRATTTSRRCRPTRSRERVVDEVGDGYAFCVVNFANPDMVGHTGSIPAVIAAVETADRCLGRVVERVTELGGVCLITADHGNAEQMLEADGVSPHTAHTTNPVPLVVTAAEADAPRGRRAGRSGADCPAFPGNRAAGGDDG